MTGGEFHRWGGGRSYLLFDLVAVLRVETFNSLPWFDLGA